MSGVIMAEAPPTMRSALEAALSDNEEAPEEATAPAESPQEPVVGEETTVEETTPGTEPEVKPEATGVKTPSAGTEELPGEYFGIARPDGIDDEGWKAFIDEVSQRDKHINQLLREKAASSKEGAEPAAVVEPVEETIPAPAAITDADILEALDLHPADNSDDEIAAKTAVPLARMVLDLKAQVEATSGKVEAGEAESFWRTSLTSLEGANGALPPGITHEDVMRAAATGGIADPIDAYWRIMGPARSAALTAVSKRKAEAEERLKQGQTPLKTKSNPKTETPIIQAKDTKEALKAAFGTLNQEHQWVSSEYGDDD